MKLVMIGHGMVGHKFIEAILEKADDELEITILAEEPRIAYDRVHLTEYFSGKSDPEVYIDNPFPKKIRDKETMQKYLDADTKLSEVSLKIEYYEVMLRFIEEILKQITNRTYQIKNSIDFMRFSSGLG